jgi:hypothetical protein
MKTLTKQQITVDGKLYGYWTDSAGALYPNSIRSESNPRKTPYLHVGSPTYTKVLIAIKGVQS